MAGPLIRVSRGDRRDPPRVRRLFDFVSSLVTVAGDFLLGDITIGRGGGRVYTNAAFGRDALVANTTGTNNLAAGNAALDSNTTGSLNTAVGNAALASNVTGTLSTAIGASALNASTGGGNTAGGVAALGTLTTGGANAAWGGSCGTNLTTASSNCLLGVQAGNTLSDDTTAVTTVTNGVYIGYNVHPGAVDSDNEIVIGSTAIGEGSNTTVIGTSSTTAAHIYGTLTAGGEITATAATGGIATLKRNDTSVTANDMVGKVQFYAADTSTTTNFIVANIEAQATNTITTDINPGRLIFRTTPVGVAATPTESFRINETQNVVFSTPCRLKGYTVATLPAGTQGDKAFVTDALAPAWGAAVAGGGAVVVEVFYNGAAWVVS